MKEGKLYSPEKERSNSVANVEGVSFSTFDGRTLFQEANFNIHTKNTLVVTGSGGVGKSLMLRIISGREIPETGQVNYSKKETRISYVPQVPEEMDFSLDDSIREVFWKSRGLDILGKEMKRMEDKMTQGNYNDTLLRKYGEYQEKYNHLDGWNADSDMKQILDGIGLDNSLTQHINPETKLRELSSGQRTKVLIGQALFSNSNLLVLDDPTSHLDKESIEWLTDYIHQANQAVIIASQERDFINRCATQIVEITESGRVINFTGNLDNYEIKRDSILAAEEVRSKSLKQEYENLLSTYSKFKNEGVFKRSDKMAARGRAMESRLERIKNEMDGIPKKQKESKVKDKKFETSENISDGAILVIYGPVIKYGDFEAVNLQGQKIRIKRREKMLIQGENGSGKSTLMRSLVADNSSSLYVETGSTSIGENLKVGYFSPDIAVGKNDDNVFNLVLNSLESRNEAEATSILTFFGFGYKGLRDITIGTLSSSEKRQVLLSIIMAQKPDVLLLDEPSDKLSETVKARLASAINGYNGSLLLISHDTEFVKNIKINHRIKLKQGRLVEFEFGINQ